jgi:hypothetical protein
MRHLRASEVAAPIAAEKFTGRDARRVMRERIRFAIRLGHPFAATQVALAACGRVVPLASLCRETRRRRGRTQLAPLPDFCSPDCPDCSVLMDIEDERVACLPPPEPIVWPMYDEDDDYSR